MVVKGKAITVWTLARDYEDRIVLRHRLQASRLQARNQAHRMARQFSTLAKGQAVWDGSSASPHHYQTDGMGRVVAYVGPMLAELDVDDV
jgi:hypothetical protein